MVDREHDLKIGLKSTAILFGKYDKAIVFLLGLCSLLLFVYIGQQQELNHYYYGGLALAFSNLVLQQWRVKSNANDDRFSAFLSNNWFGAFVFVGLVLSYLPAE